MVEKKRVVFNCDYCGKTTSENAHAFNQSIKHFCNSICYHTWSRGKPGYRKNAILSSESRLKMSLAKKGKPCPSSVRLHLQKLARERIGKPNLSMVGHIPWNKGKKMSEETKEKVRQARLRQVIPRKDTDIEVLIQDGLKSKGISFETHSGIFGQPDIAFSERKIAVFCDGDYWHSLPKSIIRDEKVNEVLLNQGWKVFRFSEEAILANSALCCEIITLALRGV